MQAILVRSREAAVKECHDIMDDGGVALCTLHIAAGECTCCTFTHGNWIGIVPGEHDILEERQTEGWTHYKEGIQCHREPTRCNAKPLDCKLYPFFPYEVVDEGDRYRVYVGAGDKKCAAKKLLISALKKQVIAKDSALPFGRHLYLVGRVGAILHEAGLSEWMQNTYDGYVGYSRGYVVVVNKEDVRHESW
jgi:hypothetical protein